MATVSAINKDFSHALSGVVGGLGEVFALSSALSRHQARPFPPCVARSRTCAHRRCAVFPTLSRRRVWVFQPWQNLISKRPAFEQYQPGRNRAPATKKMGPTVLDSLRRAPRLAASEP